MRVVVFEKRVRADARAAGIASGYSTDLVDGVLIAISHDIARVFDDLKLTPPGYPDRRYYIAAGEGVGLVEAICEDRGEQVVVVRLSIAAFDPPDISAQ